MVNIFLVHKDKRGNCWTEQQHYRDWASAQQYLALTLERASDPNRKVKSELIHVSMVQA